MFAQCDLSDAENNFLNAQSCNPYYNPRMQQLLVMEMYCDVYGSRTDAQKR
jgi:hypothetical protein